MSLLMLALTACLSPSSADASPTPALPAGNAKVNLSCFDSYEMDGRTSASVGTSSGATGGGYGQRQVYPTAPPPPPTPTTTPMTTQSPPPSGTARGGSPPKSKPSTSSSAPAPSAMDDMAESEAPVRAADKKAAGTPAPRPTDTPMEVPAGPVAVREPSLDWGAQIYLSNDDSMSLASAQRVLWAVKNDAAIDARQIRPHELLNYFSFDTAPVSSGSLFSVQGSAEKTADDQMTLALAVHGATPTRKPLDLTLVVDRSGSMSSEGRMDYVREGLGILSQQLKTGDRVDLVLFDDQVCTPLEDWVAGRDDPAVLADVIGRMQPRGSTDIGIGLKEAYRIATQPARQVGTTRGHRVVLLTDALVNQGIVDADTLAEVGAAYDQHQIRLTGVGVGSDFNDAVLDKLTEKGKGAYVYVGSEAVVQRVFGPGFDSLTQTIAHDVQFQLDLPDSLAMTRFYGEEASTDAADVQPISYQAGTSQLFLQDLRVDPSKLSPSDPVTLTISYRDASTGEPGKQVWKTTVGAMMAGDAHNLDKGRALMAWTDMLQTRAMGGDACGEALPTWTERSSKVADDAEIAYVGTLVQRWCPYAPVIEQPVSVSKVAYKVRVDSDVPIAEVTLECTDGSQSRTLSGSDMVARFDVATAGDCYLTLEGNVPMQTAVRVPVTGGDVKCTVRGGRMSCG
jgi:Ca-activated chloride channel family protein